MGDDVLDTLVNLRRQSQSQAKEDKLFKARHPAWISWEEAQQTRINAIHALREGPPAARWDRITAQEDIVILCLYTTAPPDRVGVIRTLSHGRTLKKGGDTGWYIDLTTPRLHKTVKQNAQALTLITIPDSWV